MTTCLLHDTVLATLTLFAHSGVGVSPDALRAQAGDDAQLLRQLRLGGSGIPQNAVPTTTGSVPTVSVDDAILGTTLESVKQRFKRIADSRLGRAAPSLATVEDALKRIRQLLGKVAQSKGIGGAAATETSITEDMPGTPAPAASQAGAPAKSGAVLDLSGNSAASKQAALRAISDIAVFFRRTEPHNPVAFMLEKAVVWANTPLDAWLAEVVSDSAVLASIRDRVGIARE